MFLWSTCYSICSTRIQYSAYVDLPFAFPSITIVDLRVRWACPDATTSSKTRPPTAGLLVVKAAGWDVKAQAVAKTLAKQRNLMIATQ